MNKGEARMPPRRRAKISVTVDADVLEQVDTYVRHQPGADRSKIVDEALRLWYAQVQERAMEAQFQGDGAPEDELAGWHTIRTQAAKRTFADHE